MRNRVSLNIILFFLLKIIIFYIFRLFWYVNLKKLKIKKYNFNIFLNKKIF